MSMYIRSGVKTVRGVLFLFVEQGCGGYWAMQDKDYILPPTDTNPHEQYLWEGLVTIEHGDYLIVYNEDGSIFWRWHVEMKDGKPVFDYNWWESAVRLVFGPWKPTRAEWGKAFFKEKRGLLTRF